MKTVNNEEGNDYNESKDCIFDNETDAMHEYVIM